MSDLLASEFFHESLGELLFSIENGRGRFSLLFTVSNSSEVRNAVNQAIREKCSAVRILDDSQDSNYDLLLRRLPHELSWFDVVIVEDLELSESEILRLNSGRSSLSRLLNGPLVIWCDRNLYKLFVRLAPDLESFGTVVNFDHPRCDR